MSQYGLIPSKGQRQALAVLAAAKLDMLVFPWEFTTTEVVESLPGSPSRKRVVDNLRSLVQAGYVDAGKRNVFADADNPGGYINTWGITPTGLRVALGVLG